MPVRQEGPTDRGAASAEYAGLIVLAGLILGALVPLVTTPVTENVEYALCRLLGGTGCEPPQVRHYKPAGCMVGLSTDLYGGQVDIAFVRVAQDVSFMRTTSVDNAGHKTVTVTAVDNQSIGAIAGVGAGVNAKGLNIGANAEVSANLKVGIGDSWTFTGDDAAGQADDFMGDVREKAVVDSVERSGPVGWLAGHAYDAVAGPDIRDSDIDRTEISVNAGGSAWAGFGLGKGAPYSKHDKRAENSIYPNADVGVGVSGTEKAILEHNKKTGDTSATLMLTGGPNAHESHIWDGHRWVRNYGGMLKVTKNKDGTLTSIDLIRMTNDGGRSQWVTTHLPLTNDADRDAVRDHLLSNGGTELGRQALNLTWDDMAPSDPPGPDANPLQRLLYEKGQTVEQNYAYAINQRDYGASVKLGLVLGGDVTIGGTDQKLNGARYLGAPGPDGVRRYRDYPECHA